MRNTTCQWVFEGRDEGQKRRVRLEWNFSAAQAANDENVLVLHSAGLENIEVAPTHLPKAVA